ncbi:hypothetical protein HDV01_001901 [Terramyces sp. JEL0728]|nr:hypothetical protein HDV01_001901 [Terramyces sp. JEL0728]
MVLMQLQYVPIQWSNNSEYNTRLSIKSTLNTNLQLTEALEKIFDEGIETFALSSRTTFDTKSTLSFKEKGKLFSALESGYILKRIADGSIGFEYECCDSNEALDAAIEPPHWQFYRWNQRLQKIIFSGEDAGQSIFNPTDVKSIYGYQELICKRWQTMYNLYFQNIITCSSSLIQKN